MKDGFITAAAITPKIAVADVEGNTQEVIRLYHEAEEAGAKLIVFPELVITSYTCNDLFLQQELIDHAKAALKRFVDETRGTKALTFVGVPFEADGKLYNTAAAVTDGKLLGLVPKRFLPNYNEYYEERYFYPGREEIQMVSFDGYEVPFGMCQLFTFEPMGLKVAAEICEDMWAPCPPATFHAMAGANVIVNLSASVEVTGKRAYREKLVTGQSSRLIAGYIYASSGDGESTQDLVFSGQRIIAENGIVLAESERFSAGITMAQIDIQRLRADRRRMTTYDIDNRRYRSISFDLEMEETKLTRTFAPRPFVPDDEAGRSDRCEEILTIQALGLKKRLEHIGAKKAVIGISGGLDSTLALLVCVKAFSLLGLNPSGIIAVTMPAFGTTSRTYHNALTMSRALDCTLREINIKEAVNIHFRDIGHDPAVTDVTYENSQARERTQILMDLANQEGGIVIGTGDLSELALGWATYNGDHMSMYAVNCSVPKTLVRYLVRWCADNTDSSDLRTALLDVLDTPVSPELLPPKDGEIAQVTEDLVGPYELHDFFLYYVLRFGYRPMKIFRIALKTFEGVYDRATVLKWLKSFYWRFFAQQYKRSCVPDGPKVGSVALSPRGDLRMPSDAVVKVWREELDKLEG